MDLMRGIDNLRKIIPEEITVLSRSTIINRLIDAANQIVMKNIDEAYRYAENELPEHVYVFAEVMFQSLVWSDTVDLLRVFKRDELCRDDERILTSEDADILPVGNNESIIDVRDVEDNDRINYRGFTFRPIEFALNETELNSNDIGYSCNITVEFYGFKNKPIDKKLVSEYRNKITLDAIAKEAK